MITNKGMVQIRNLRDRTHTVGNWLCVLLPPCVSATPFLESVSPSVKSAAMSTWVRLNGSGLGGGTQVVNVPPTSWGDQPLSSFFLSLLLVSPSKCLHSPLHHFSLPLSHSPSHRLFLLLIVTHCYSLFPSIVVAK